MKKDLSQLEIQTLYNRILNDGVSELDGIKPFEIRQIFDYAKNINKEAVKFCVGLLELNQNYNYPPEYPEDKRLEYWIRKYPDYSESKYAMDLLNDKFKEVKSISKENTNSMDVKEPNHIFGYSNDEKYFYPDKIKEFEKIEIEMLNRNFFMSGKWNKEKKILVAFIYILQKLNFLKSKIKGKNERTLLLAYRRFFENRYQTKISKEMQPSKFDVSRLKSFEADFFFIPEIKNL